MQNDPHSWTPEEIENLKTWFSENKSYEFMSKTLNVPVETIRRKAYKLGLKLQKPEKPEIELQHVQCATPGVVLPPRVRMIHNLTPTSKPWTERKSNECAFPVGNTDNPLGQYSCCAKTFGKKYCDTHQKIMFTPPTSRAERANKNLMKNGV